MYTLSIIHYTTNVVVEVGIRIVVVVVVVVVVVFVCPASLTLGLLQANKSFTPVLHVWEKQVNNTWFQIETPEVETGYVQDVTFLHPLLLTNDTEYIYIYIYILKLLNNVCIYIYIYNV